MTEQDYKNSLMQPKHFANTLMQATMSVLDKLNSYEEMAIALESCAMGLIDCSKVMKNKKIEKM